MKKNIFTTKIVYFLFFLGMFSLTNVGCKKKYEPEKSFIKIYDDSNGNRNYFPLSIQQTNDDGFMILSAYNGWNIHLLKANKEGEMLWELDLPNKYVNAVPNLIVRNDSLFFVCMDAVGLYTYVMHINENDKNVSEFQTFTEILYPLYVYDNQTAVYILNYERNSAETGVSELNSNMDQIIQAESVSVYTDVEEEVVDHLSFTGKRFPFFVSVTPENNHIVFNGFYNYSFSTVFLDANLNFSGVYNGAAFDGGMNAISPLGNNKFSLARFSFSNLYINPNATLSPTTIDIAESIPAQGKAELDAESPILIKNLTINSKNYVVYLATTKSNQLLISFYESGTSELKASKYFGQSVPLQAADFSLTSDGGLMILSRVTVMGSFNRIATIKLSKEELVEIVE